jgi:hypothetical protein
MFFLSDRYHLLYQDLDTIHFYSLQLWEGLEFKSLKKNGPWWLVMAPIIILGSHLFKWIYSIRNIFTTSLKVPDFIFTNKIPADSPNSF